MGQKWGTGIKLHDRFPKHVRCSCGTVCFSQIAVAATFLLTVRVEPFYSSSSPFNKSFSTLSPLVPDVRLAGEHENF